MMGQQTRTESLFYYFRLEDQIPKDHLLRVIDDQIDLSFVRERVKGLYSATGRPSIDPEMLLRLLLVGYLYGITSERRLLEEVRMNLAYRWFTRLDLEQEVPDHSTFSKNRHGRFRESGVFREIFEEIVRRCLQAGLVEGKNLAVDGTMIEANASPQSRIPRTAREYLTELEKDNPVSDRKMTSTTDPDAVWAKKVGPAKMAYFDNYLIDTRSRVILGVEATPALFHQETVAARKMVEQVQKLGLRPETLGADKAYGSGEFLAWLLGRGVQPHIAVIDRRHQTDGHFTRDQFRYEPAEECLLLPRGKGALVSRTPTRESRLRLSVQRSAVRGLPAKKALHLRTLSPTVCARARIRPAGSPRAGRNTSLRAFPAGSLQNRSFVCGTQAAHATRAGKTTPSVEYQRAVLVGRHCPKLETSGEIPCAAATQTTNAGRMMRGEYK